MATIDERVAYLEGKVDEHSHGFGEVREMVLHLDQKLDLRLEAIDRRLDGIDQRMDRRQEAMDLKLTRLDDKVSRQFLWILGVQIAVLVAVIGALAGS